MRGLFAREAVLALTEFVASELTTLSECDLVTGHRRVVGLPGVRLGERDIECFDRHFFEQPLVHFHGFEGGRVTRRISDPLSRSEFRRSAIYADYDVRVGLEHTVTVPLLIDKHKLVSVVLNRRGLDFSERDCERLDVLHRLAHGKADAAIAALLGLSPRTAQKHLQHIYIKLGVETRTAVVMRSMGKRLRHWKPVRPVVGNGV
jgi:hypothetical protein